ncbi:hypothetical protein [Streptomyces microflavus]|uniref:hypothetical protein n=1 Tax=Streptomyces microflavus TaxID=1919 RepID=UPI0036EB5C2E
MWLDDHPARSPRVHGFLAWTSRKGHNLKLTVDISASAFTGQLIARDTRWRLVDRLIHGDEIPAADKAAGLLALLFAQEPSRIIALTTDHMDISGGTVTLRLGKVPVRMPPPLNGTSVRSTPKRRPGTPPPTAGSTSAASLPSTSTLSG